MNRRDTIIAAVLVNAGLLLVLFVTAVRSDKKMKSSQDVVEEKVVNLDAITLPNINGQVLAKQFLETPSTVVNREVKEEVGALQQREETNVVVVKDERLDSLRNNESNISASQSRNSEESKDFVEIVVKKGDFLERIARANHTTVSEIMKMNRMTSTQLKIGQVLKVPVDTVDSTESVHNGVIRQNIGNVEYYVVKEGDSPWTIALRHKMKLEDLLKLNDLDEYKARYLKPGDRIRVK